MDTSMCVVNIPTLGKIISFEVPRPIPALMGWNLARSFSPSVQRVDPSGQKSLNRPTQ